MEGLIYPYDKVTLVDLDVAKWYYCQQMLQSYRPIARWLLDSSRGAMQRIRTDTQDLVILSHRERDVLRLLIRGMADKEIAYHLGISTHTVKIHLRRITSGLGIQGRFDAALWVFTHPEALAGLAAPRSSHQAGCNCGSPLCSAFRLIDRSAA